MQIGIKRYWSTSMDSYHIINTAKLFILNFILFFSEKTGADFGSYWLYSFADDTNIVDGIFLIQNFKAHVYLMCKEN